MKFNIYGKDFKKLIDRISIVVPKRTVLPALEHIKITALPNNTIKAVATDCESFAEIDTYGCVIEPGETYVRLDNLKRVYGIPDDITITADCDTFDVRSKKKSYTVNCVDLDGSFPVFPDISDMNLVMRIDGQDFIKKIGKIDCMRADTDINRMLTCFYLETGKERISTLDGHRIGVASLNNADLIAENENVIIPGQLYRGLKSIAGKNDGNCDVYTNKNYIMFKGDDYNFILKKVDGQYYNIENVILNNADYKYNVDPDELEKIAAEYAKLVDRKNAKPMIFYNNSSMICTGIQTDSIKTSDILENAKAAFGADCEFYAGFNPGYINDACKMFNDDFELSGMYNSKIPIMMKDETYIAVILPININNIDVDYMRKLVS